MKDEGARDGGAAERSQPSPARLEGARAETVELLSECFARDMLSVKDLERRVGLAHEAVTMAELGQAVDGLDVGGALALEGRAVDGVRSGVLATPAEVGASDRAIAVFGEVGRSGQWVPARTTTVVSVMGSVVIDLREARLGPGRTTLSVVAVLGSVELVVPPGMRVHSGGSAVMGTFEQGGRSSAPALPDEPVVRVEGFSVLGEVSIQTRRPGESKREARKRRRAEKRERKRRAKGRLRSLG